MGPPQISSSGKTTVRDQNVQGALNRVRVSFQSMRDLLANAASVSVLPGVLHIIKT
ncbi:hypothetical protein KXV38_008606, partial [Aspergillus fumigatus]